MARKKAARRTAKSKPRRKASSSRPRKAARAAKRGKKPARSARRPASASPRKAAPKAKGRGTKKAAPKKPTARNVRKASQPAAQAPRRSPRLDRQRRVLHEAHGVPSSLDLDRRGSAARTGRDELNERRREQAGMTPRITAGDPDVNVEDAYFTGEEAPGGDNPTPDQDVVEEIGQALGVEYQDNEELRGGDKVAERDRHRWEFDPASSEDYRERK